MDDVSYGALAVALSVVAGIYTWYAYRKHGLGAGLKGAGITLLPIAAWMTDTLEMFAKIGGAVGRWATGLVFSPVVWAGIVLAGIAVVLFGAGRAIQARRGDAPPPQRTREPEATPASLPTSRPGQQPAPTARGKAAPAPVDDDLADIEAILKSRGIT